MPKLKKKSTQHVRPDVCSAGNLGPHHTLKVGLSSPRYTDEHDKLGSGTFSSFPFTWGENCLPKTTCFSRAPSATRYMGIHVKQGLNRHLTESGTLPGKETWSGERGKRTRETRL